MRLLFPPFLFPACALSLALGACSSSTTSSGFTDSDGGAGGGGFGGDSGAFGEGGATGQPPDGCSEAAKLVYVVSEENDLYSFKPASLTFKKIGTLNCDSVSTPNSMAIERTGTAWVNYADGSLFKVSTADASCQSTAFQPGQSGFHRFGMAFSSNSSGSQQETLYVVGIEGLNQGKGLAKIDLSTFALTPIGDFSGSLQGVAAELTGTGDAKLFGFFTTNPTATLAEIDKTTGATSSSVALTGVNTGLAWAFSFWGGDFWFYTSDGTNPSIVTQYKSATDKSISVVSSDVGGFKIVGAGVSTCAPTAPPPK